MLDFFFFFVSLKLLARLMCQMSGMSSEVWNGKKEESFPYKLS
jgi:hypothetical protein